MNTWAERACPRKAASRRIAIFFMAMDKGTGGPGGPPASGLEGGRLFLAAEDAAEGAAEDAPQAAARLLLFGRAAAERTAEDTAEAAEEAAAAALQGDEDVVQVHVTVAVLVLDDALEAAHDLGQEGQERSAHGAELELGEDVRVEQVAGEGRDRARGRVGLAGEEVLDEVDSAGLRGRLGEGTEDGVGQAAEDLLLHVGRNLDVAPGNALGYRLEEDVAKIHLSKCFGV